MNFREFLENAWWQNMSNVATSSPDPGTFYDVLTDRGPDRGSQYMQFGLKKREPEYVGLINKLASDLSGKGYKISQESWLHVQMPYQQQYAANYDGVEAFKAYRTFEPDGEMRISKFLATLSGFADKLKELQDSDPQYPDRMQFKIPATLKMFFYHPDSLVVHWRNKFNRQKVNSLIDQYFTSAGIKFAPREARATDGFDMNKKDSFAGGSHSQLVAQAMAKLMSQNPQFKQMPQPKKQDWLKQWITYFNGLNPQQMYQYISSQSSV